MNLRSMPSKLLGIVFAGVLTLAGAFVGRALGDDDDDDGGASTTAPVIITELDEPTVDVPVIEPVLLGEEPPAPVDDADDTFGLGMIVSSAEVPESALVPADTEPLPPPEPSLVDLTAPISPPPGGWAEPEVVDDGEGVSGVMPIEVAEAMAEGADTAAGEEGGSGEASDSGDSGRVHLLDPCAPPEGTPVDEACPEGRRSTVLALVSPPDLWLTARQVAVAPVASFNSCSAGPVADDQLMVELATNAPATFTVTVSSGFEREPLASLTVTTQDSARAGWEAFLAGASGGEDWRAFAIAHCLVFDGLPSGVQLHVSANVADIFDRLMTRTFYAQIGPDPVRPPTIVQPVSTSQVLVSVPHEPDQYADIRAWLDDGWGDCAQTGFGLEQTEPVTSEVDPERLLARGWIDTMTSRTWTLISIPESSTAVICMRTYDSTGPSFETERPSLTEIVQVHSPDLLVPIVSVESVDVQPRIGVARLTVTLSHVRGETCGGYSGEIDSAGVLNDGWNDPCDPTARWDHADEVAKPVLVTTSLYRSGVEPVRASAVLAVRARPCTGGDPVTGFAAGCAVPESEWYRVPFGTVPLPSGICSPGIFESTCEPPRRDTVAGVATIKVEWRQGATSGRSGWVVDPLDTSPRDTSRDELAQLDTAPALSVGGPDTDPVVTGTLTADRAVQWSVEVPGEVCMRSGATPVLTSSTPSTTFAVSIEGLCPGQEVQLTATLTDPATGASSNWGRFDRPGGRDWHGGYLIVPAPRRNVAIILGAAPDRGDYPVWTPVAMELRTSWDPDYEGWRFAFPSPLPTDPTLRCRSTDYRRYVDLYGFSREAFVALSVPDRTYIDVTVVLARGEGSWESCIPLEERYRETVRFRAEVTYDDITQPGGVRITSPEGAAFEVVLVIQPR